jgi:hypothetical protein
MRILLGWHQKGDKNMNKFFALLLLGTLFGCDTGVDAENACAEINSTRMFESSKRMEVLKSYGLTPVQAEDVESIMMTQRIPLDDANELARANPDMSYALHIQEETQTCFDEFALTCDQIIAFVESDKNVDDWAGEVGIQMIECCKKINE